MIITPFVLKNISSIADLILGDDNDNAYDVEEHNELHDHIVLLGYGRLGRKISAKLDARAVNYIAIEHNIHNVKEAQKEGKNVIFGNAASKTILESVNVKDAAVVIVALDNSEKLHLISDVLSQVATKAKVVIKVDKFIEKDTLLEEFPEFEIIVGTEQMARGMVDSVLKCQVP
jgi:CPA2 family monovalent cation:H+ antiporter-2